MTLAQPRWTRCLMAVSTAALLPVVVASCTSDLLTGSLTGAANTATDIVFDGVRSLVLTGGPGDSLLDYVLNVAETAIDASADLQIDRSIPDDPMYD